jgi:hypothetical protein
MNNNSSLFRDALAKAIREKIRELRADGTVGMSLANLYAVVRAPAIAGAPLGTNAAYYYREMFEEVARKVAGRFIIS